MGFYLLYDHLDHLFDELAFAQRTHRNVHAYMKLHEQRQEQDDSITIATSISVTWIRPTEGIIHAARMPVDSITLALNDPSMERQITQLRERSRAARELVIGALKDHQLAPDHNVLLTAGLREELMQLETEQLLWEIVVSGEGAERRVVPLA
jgi:hypothetical protein